MSERTLTVNATQLGREVGGTAGPVLGVQVRAVLAYDPDLSLADGAIASLRAGLDVVFGRFEQQDLFAEQALVFGQHPAVSGQSQGNCVTQGR